MLLEWWANLGRRTRFCLLAGLLAGLPFVAYLPALAGGFVWDDDNSLTQNPLVRSADGIEKFWFSTESADYWPVTESVFWLEWRAWGSRPAGYHAVSLAVHLASAFLLWSILDRLRIPGGWLGAALFAVHPVNVESVAWIAQLKNVLALAFYLGAIRAFLGSGWTESPSTRAWLRTGWRWYSVSLLLFLLALLSKGSVVFLPLVLLGLLLWHRRLRWGDAGFLAPFFALGFVLAAVNVWFQGHRLGPGEVIRQAGGLERLLGAAAAIWFYLGKALLPVRLSFIYPLWRIDSRQWLWYLPLAAGVALAAGLAVRSRPLLGAWLYFCTALVPVLGFADIYFMKFSLVADHYQYPALVGIAALAGYGWSRWRRVSAGADAGAVAVLGACALLTWRQAGNYRDAGTLYRATIEANPGCSLACYNLGVMLLAEGRFAEAAARFEQGLGSDPGSANGHLNLGDALRNLGQRREALAQYRLAWELRPADAEAHFNAGVILGEDGRLAEAAAEYRAALGLRPGYAEARVNLAMALRDARHLPEAVAEFKRAQALQPGSAEISNDLGLALADEGDRRSAVDELRRALALRPDFPEAQNNLGNLLRLEGEAGEAQFHYERAVELEPDYAEARCNLASLLAAQGRMPEAIGQLRQALRSQPDYPEALDSLGNALQSLRQYNEAIDCYRRALALRPGYATANRNLLGLLRALGRNQ
jgi:protein O-mannosyl-transferase